MIQTSCSCREKFAANGFGCEVCPEGTRPSLDNMSCVSLECAPDQIFRSDLTCPTCEWCPAGSQPDPTRTTCIVQPRPPVVVVQGARIPRCDMNSIYNADRTECIPCPAGSTASRDNMRCVSDCNGAMDIIRTDGTCFTCCNGNVPDATRTRCIKAGTGNLAPVRVGVTVCDGEREIYSKDNKECIKCMPYTRAQRDNTICLSDQCSVSQIITWLGTCADCVDGTKPDDNRGSCVAPSTLRLNALAEVEEEPEQASVEAPEQTKATKKRSFPTALVAGLGILILIVTAATGMIIYRNRTKPAQSVEQVDEAANQDESVNTPVSKKVVEEEPTGSSEEQ